MRLPGLIFWPRSVTFSCTVAHAKVSWWKGADPLSFGVCSGYGSVVGGQVWFSCTLFELSLVFRRRSPVGERMPEGAISFASDAQSALVRPRSVCTFWFSCRGANIRKGRNEVKIFFLTAPGGGLNLGSPRERLASLRSRLLRPEGDVVWVVSSVTQSIGRVTYLW